MKKAGNSQTIALYGNIANNCYVIAKALRMHTNIDVHLYLEDDADLVQAPESEDPEIKDNYPPWIHRSKYWRISGTLYFWRPNLIKELNKYDIVVLSGRGVMLASFLKNETVFYVTGSDLTLIPFYKAYKLLYAHTGNTLKSLIIQYLQRKGIKRVKQIWTQPFSPFVDALRRLNVASNQIKDMYFPVMVNTNLFKFDSNAFNSEENNVRLIVDNYKFIVFHPSRLMINPHPYLKGAGQWKQNDLLIYAFADFIKKSHALDAVLVMPDRTVSPDLLLAKNIIKELGIENNVVWIKAENPDGFTRKELVKFYSIADVVADDFGIGWFGSVVLEGFSVGKPVISYVDEQVMKILYPWHPFLSSNTQEGNCQFLTRLYKDKKFRKTQGDLGRKWIDEFHSPERASKIYVEQFHKILVG